MNEAYCTPPTLPVSFERIAPEEIIATDTIRTDAGNPLTEAGAFASILPYIKSLFASGECRTDEDLIHRLADTIYTLQDIFLEALYDALQEADITTDDKLTLHLDDKARLVPTADCPQKAAIRHLLTERPEFTSLFVEIAAQSAALEHLRSLYTMSLYDSVQEGYTALLNTQNERRYQLSLKGEMNHFYFC